MEEWKYAETNPAAEFAEVRYFSVKKHQPAGDVEFLITVKEYAHPARGEGLRFFAQVDKQINQKTAPHTPCGWGSTLLTALADCVRAINQFPYEAE